MKLIYLLLLMTLAPCIQAGELAFKVAMREKSGTTFYVPGSLAGENETEFMVDTGSGYSAINQSMLNRLKQNNNVKFLRTVSGVLANGDKTTLSVYQISSLTIGEKCTFTDIKAVVLPGKTRNILGLDTLKKAAPFAMSVNPPQLLLSNCNQSI